MLNRMMGETIPVLQSSKILCFAPEQHPKAQLSLCFELSTNSLCPHRNKDPLTETQLLCFRGRIISQRPFLSEAHDSCSRLELHGARMLLMKCFHSSTLIIPLHYRVLPQGPSKESWLSSFPAETKTRPPNKLHLQKFSLSPCSGSVVFFICIRHKWKNHAISAASPRQTKQSAHPQPGVVEVAATPQLTMQGPCHPSVPSMPQPTSSCYPASAVDLQRLTTDHFLVKATFSLCLIHCNFFPSSNNPLVFSVLKFKVAITNSKDLTWRWLLRMKPVLAVTAKPFARAQLFTSK